MPPVQIPNHAHCRICGRAVAFGDKTCSKECESQMEGLQKKRKQTLLLIYGMMGLAVIVLLLQIRGGA